MGWPRIGHTPLWDLNKIYSKGWLARPLWAVLWLYEYAFYKNRVDVATIKTDAARWKVVTGDIRYFHALFGYLGPPGHILWNIKWPLGMVMLVAVAMATWEQLRATCCPKLPAFDATNVSYNCFRLSSFAMSLLLAFRLRSCYDRWWQARCGFTGVGGAAVSLVHMAAVYVKDEALLYEFQRWCPVWQFTVYQFIQSDKKLLPEAQALLTPEELAVVMSVKKPRQVVGMKIRSLIQEASQHLHDAQAQAMEATFARGWDQQSACSRIRYQATPQAVSMTCTGFVTIWLMLLPMGLWEERGGQWYTLLIVFFVALLLLSVDSVATQLEHPWKLIPMHAYLDSTMRDCKTVHPAKKLREIRARQLGKVELDADEKPLNGDP